MFFKGCYEASCIDNCVDLLYLHAIVYLVNCGYLLD